MKWSHSLLALCLCSSLATAADMTPILDNGPPLSDREEYVNKALGLLFHRTLFAEGDPQLAADLIMAPNFVNHDVEEPSGAQNMANFFLHPEQYENPTPARGGGPRSASAQQLTRLFSVTDGAITMMAYPGEGDVDPGAWFASNMFETKNSKVTQWWFSGPTQGEMGAAPGGQRDFSQYYPQMGNTVVGMPMVIANGTATRAERDANKVLVTEFFNEFFNNKNYSSASKYLSPDLVSHIKDSPQGSQFVNYARDNQVMVTAADTSQVLFLLADGELVDIGWPYEFNGDPGAWYAQNLLRVQEGKIVEWWYSTYPEGQPRFINSWNSIHSISNSRVYQKNE